MDDRTGNFVNCRRIMSDEQAKLILGDTAISAIEESSSRRRRRREKRSAPITNCENCGATLHGHWCAQCGQPAIDYRRSFRHVVLDVLESFLNWDSKFFASLWWLVIRPWRLTNEFLAGHRVRYVHPLRLYLLASVLFFFVVNYATKSIHLHAKNFSPAERYEIESDLNNDKDVPPAVRERVRQALEAKGVAPPKEMMSPALHPSVSPTATVAASTTASPIGAVASPANATPSPPDYGPLVQFDKPPSDSIGKWLEGRAKEKMGEHGTKMALFIQTLFSNLPYMMFCCIPLFAFVLKILYIRRRIFYIDHLVYALHIHSFAYVSLMIIAGIMFLAKRAHAGALGGWIIAAVWIAFTAQIFLSIRRVYRQGWFFSIFKFFVGGMVYLTVLSIAIAVTFFVTLAIPD